MAQNKTTVAIVIGIIKPYFDPEFVLVDFVNGSEKAVEVWGIYLIIIAYNDVFYRFSQLNSQIKELKGLITAEIIPDLQKVSVYYH